MIKIIILSTSQQVAITCVHCAVHLIWNLLSGSFRHPTHTRDETRHLRFDHVCKGALFRRNVSPSHWLRCLSAHLKYYNARMQQCTQNEKYELEKHFI